MATMVPLSDTPRNGSHVNGVTYDDLWSLRIPSVLPLPEVTPSWLEPQVDPAVLEQQRLEAELAAVMQRIATARDRAVGFRVDDQAGTRTELGTAHDERARRDQRDAAAPTVPTRVAAALLTLKLRAAQQEAVQAEAQALAAEAEAERARLGSSADPLIEARTRQLEEMLREARVQAAVDVAPARREANRMVSAATPAPPERDEEAVTRLGLEAELAVARRRAAIARDRLAARVAQVQVAQVQVAPHSESVSSTSALAEIERTHETVINMVREAARMEAERILSDARQRAALHQGGASSFPNPGGNHVG